MTTCVRSVTTALTNFEFEIDDYECCDACDYGFFVVTAFILAELIVHGMAFDHLLA